MILDALQQSAHKATAALVWVAVSLSESLMASGVAVISNHQLYRVGSSGAGQRVLLV
jgi:hypothetical protein